MQVLHPPSAKTPHRKLTPLCLTIPGRRCYDLEIQNPADTLLFGKHYGNRSKSRTRLARFVAVRNTHK